MPNYRRSHVPGGTYFFTVKTELNAPIFSNNDHVVQLGSIIREAVTRWPFEINAIVLLPDHLHAIWTLPPGDDDYSKRWGWIKKEFTKVYLANGGQEQFTSVSKKRNRRRGVWQRKFWEHTIEDENDYEAHFDYIHWNPVKHGYVKCPSHWSHSSFHKWGAKGVYPKNWGCGEQSPISMKSIKDVGE
ncbi:REP-associated tyrosine transposase [Thalassoglobus polymorphus]|uniref:Transposase IS200 like protein n=1 Tax=Thalassoglobus polymorphus TaxID=2527994 RepID=A0A517QJU0_9PLAN|nr:transposase [Thalassoglobus polymorphus]QDT31910.1 Transposase IS200 like protein [Thalassoglobus polymorphus]